MGNFGVANWIVLIIYFVAMLYLGTKVGKSNNSTESFFSGAVRFPGGRSGCRLWRRSVQRYLSSACRDGVIPAV